MNRSNLNKFAIGSVFLLVLLGGVPFLSRAFATGGCSNVCTLLDGSGVLWTHYCPTGTQCCGMLDADGITNFACCTCGSTCLWTSDSLKQLHLECSGGILVP
jgi:hypothetical protein